jgi:hypothetical protein
VNWRRGLFRVWLVLSIVWIAAVEVVAKVSTGIWIRPWGGKIDLFIASLGTLLGPPIVVFLVGLVLVWVSVGFRRG